jgi:hypothetical protein
VLACVPASEFFELDISRWGLLGLCLFHELLPLFQDNKRVPCKWLKSLSDKISPKLKSELSPCLGCRLLEKLECLRFHNFLELQVFLHMLTKQVHFSLLLSSLISGKFKGIFCLAMSPASALNLRFWVNGTGIPTMSTSVTIIVSLGHFVDVLGALPWHWAPPICT